MESGRRFSGRGLVFTEEGVGLGKLFKVYVGFQCKWRGLLLLLEFGHSKPETLEPARLNPKP